MLAILDYGAGNQTSVARALEYLGAEHIITAQPDVLLNADGIIFPGVGSAGQAMRHLQERGLDAALRSAAQRGQPLLGICLGCQILLNYTEEADTRTLGLVPGQCKRFSKELTEEDGSPIRIPHMGWNRIKQHKPSVLLEGISPEAEFYFAHSYYVEPDPALILASTHYGRDFCSVYGRDGLWAVQFHAEKSGPAGLRLLENFYKYCSRKGKCSPKGS